MFKRDIATYRTTRIEAYPTYFHSFYASHLNHVIKAMREGQKDNLFVDIIGNSER